MSAFFLHILCPFPHFPRQSPLNQWCRTESQSDFFLSLPAPLPTSCVRGDLGSPYLLTFYSKGSSETPCVHSLDPHSYPSAKAENGPFLLYSSHGCLCTQKPHPDLFWCQKHMIWAPDVNANCALVNSRFKMREARGRGQFPTVGWMTSQSN